MKPRPSAPRPRIELAALQRRAGDAAAPSTLRELAGSRPRDAAAGQAADAKRPACGRSRGRADPAAQLRAVALARRAGRHRALEADPSRARLVRAAPEARASLVAAAKWMAGEKLEHEQFHPTCSARWTMP
jgi:hypothetical protein